MHVERMNNLWLRTKLNKYCASSLKGWLCRVKASTVYLLPHRILRLDENSIASAFADVLKHELELSQMIFQKTPTQFLRLRCKSRRTTGSLNLAPIVFIWHNKLLFRPAKRERNTNKFYFDSADWPCSWKCSEYVEPRGWGGFIASQG